MDENPEENLEEQEPVEEVTLNEHEQPAPEEPPIPDVPAVGADRVRELVEASRLPDAAKAKLSEAQYADEDAVAGAIAAEVAYIKEITNSGKPFGLGAGSAPEHRPRTAEEADADWKRILTEVGMTHLVGG